MRSWVDDNPKPDGTSYSMYRDGLKIYTTLDFKMQGYAETAVEKHLKNLQKEFDAQNKQNKTAPFRSISSSEIESILNRGIKNSDRYKTMRRKGINEDSIMATFNRKREMRLFSWEGPIDTIMTPKDSIRYYKSFLNTGMMSMTPQTGEIKAWVGGVNYKFFKYEHVKQAKRQVGSTFKPFVYATAIDQLHLSPCDEYPNTPFTIPKGRHGVTEDWTPDNSGGDYGGMKTLKQALAESINTITARVINKTGPESVINLIDKLGIDVSRIDPVAAIALGTADISVYDMVSAYSTFANKGVYVKPYAIQRIEDKNGTILYQHQPESRDVLSEESAFVTIKLLEGVTRFGSGRRLRTNSDYAKGTEVYKRAVTGYPYALENDIAGKTGTTQNQSDGWFIGMVPNLATGVWVGGEDRSVRFPTITYGQGATLALPIWGMYMTDIYNDITLDISKDEFERPDNLNILIDCDGATDELENGEGENKETTEFEIDF